MSQPNKTQLLATFNKYSGRSVLHPMATGICQTIEEISAEARKLGLTTRFIYPGQATTTDYSDTRLNINIVQKNNGAFKVGGFDFG